MFVVFFFLFPAFFMRWKLFFFAETYLLVLCGRRTVLTDLRPHSFHGTLKCHNPFRTQSRNIIQRKKNCTVWSRRLSERRELQNFRRCCWAGAKRSRGRRGRRRRCSGLAGVHLATLRRPPAGCFGTRAHLRKTKWFKNSSPKPAVV